MIVTKLEAMTKTKYKVYLNDEFAFVLYKGELSQYHIAEDVDVSEETIERIKNEVLLKRAKLRALHLLNVMDRTEAGLTKKLRENLYPEDVIEKAMQYVKSFGYIEDERYAKQYVQNRQMKQSKRQMQAAMYQKGLDHDTITRTLETYYDKEDEIAAIRRIAEKKGYQPETSTDKEKKKIFDFLVRKGFSYEGIRQVLQVSSWNA